MASQTAKQEDDGRLLLPLVSAADVGPSNWARVQFNEHIGDMLREYARRRAPCGCSDHGYRNHLLGIAGEVAVATWQRGSINREIYPDFVGDDGTDVVAPSRWRDGRDMYQVKTTRDVGNPEQTVTEWELEQADYFVLCRSGAPARFVEIVGYIEQPTLRKVGTAYGRNGYILSPEILRPVGGTYHSPSDVRDVTYR